MAKVEQDLDTKVERLHRLTVYGRWLSVAACWLFFAPWGLWGLRKEIYLWQQHFTWTALRYGVAYNPLPSSLLSFCLGLTAAVLVWQCRNILLGIPLRERYRLEQWVTRIEAKGKAHPLWRWVIKPKSARP